MLNCDLFVFNGQQRTRRKGRGGERQSHMTAMVTLTAPGKDELIISFC